MKKEHSDSAIGELLKKLHASFGSDKAEKPEKKRKNDADDGDLMEQLRATLDKVGTSEEKAEAPREEMTPSPSEEVSEEEPAQEERVEDAPEDVPVAEEIIEEPVPKPEKKPRKRTPKPKKEPEAPAVEPIEAPAPQVIEESAIEETVIEEPIIQEPIIEEPIIEKTIIEEPIVEEPIVEEPIIEEPIIEEPIIEEPIIEEPVIEEVPTEPPKKVQTIKVRVREIPVPDLPPRRDAAVSVPRTSGEFDFAKVKKEPDRIVIKPAPTPKVTPKSDASDAHIIRPSAHGTAAEPIIIRPRREEAAPRPKVKGAEPVPPTHTVTVEAMQKNNEHPTETAERTEPTAKKSSVRASGNVSMPSHSDNEFLIRKDPPTEEAPVKATSSSAQPKKTASAQKSTSAHKKTSKPRKKAVTEHPEDEILHEALEVANEELVNTAELMTAPPEEGLEEIPEDAPELRPEEAEPVKKRSAFRLRRTPKKKIPDENVSVLELIHRRSGLSEDDVTMMFELGYENELGRLVGYETMKKLRCEHLRRNSQSEHRHYRTAFGYRDQEYVSTKQNEAIRAAYASDKRKLLRRVLFTALITFVLFFLDFPYLLGSTVFAFDASYPLLFPILALIGLTASAALSVRQLYAGVRSILRFTPTPYSIASLTVSAAALCSLLGLIPAVQISVPANFLASLLLFALALGDVYRLSGELRAFRIVSVETEKNVLEVAAPRKKKLLRGNKIVKVINDDIDENLYRVRRTEQTTGFFRRFNAMEYAAQPLTVFIGSAFAAAVLLGFVTALGRQTAGAALSAALTTLLLCAPVSLIFVCFYPLGRANSILEKRNCALLGDEATEEYSEEQTVIFRDTDLYTAEKCAQISIREGDEFRHDLRLAEIIFRKLGGTLGGLGVSASKAYDNDPAVSFVRILPSGLEAIVDSKSYVLLGSAEFLRRSGIRVPKESSDVELRRTESISVMYVAIDGVLRLSYEIKYKTDPDFEDTLGLLCGDGTVVAIQSYDPNLTDEFLQESRREFEDPVTVVRPGRFEAEALQEVVDTGAVALGRRRDIALPLHAAKCIHAVRRRGFFFQLGASVAGAVLAVLLTLFDPFGTVTPFLIALYQLVWSTVAILTARGALNASNLNV